MFFVYRLSHIRSSDDDHSGCVAFQQLRVFHCNKRNGPPGLTLEWLESAFCATGHVNRCLSPIGWCVKRDEIQRDIAISDWICPFFFFLSLSANRMSPCQPPAMGPDKLFHWRCMCCSSLASRSWRWRGALANGLGVTYSFCYCLSMGFTASEGKGFPFFIYLSVCFI